MPRFAFAAVALVGCRAAAASAPRSEPPPALVADGPTTPPLAPELEPASAPSATPAEAANATFESACNEQAPQEFLMRSSYAYDPAASPEERARRRALHARAIEYRTRHYGYVEGFGDPAWNRSEPERYARVGKFFGIGVRMNAKVLLALSCVEAAIKAECAEAPYAPHNLEGLRFRNTFHNGEVTNHAYGIAIDLDWDTNPCCHCVAPLSQAEVCKRPVASPLERTNIPKCWVDRFERYGFYWLGNDELEDTMHFEFLGDPDKIRRGSG